MLRWARRREWVALVVLSLTAVTVGAQTPKPEASSLAAQPILAVVALTVDGDAMKMAQMLERSETIKRGSGKRADPP